MRSSRQRNHKSTHRIYPVLYSLEVMQDNDLPNTKRLVKLPRLSGKYKEVKVTFIGVSFYSGEGRNQTRFADDGFAPYLLDEIFRRQSILSKRKGMLKKNHHCRKCDADLMGLKAYKRRFTLNVNYEKLPPFKMEIDMPAIPCRQCGTSNAINEDNTESIIAGAIAKAFESLSRIIPVLREKA